MSNIKLNTLQEKPLVSVVITSYNQRDQIIRAIESVLAQTYKNIQIVIADDYSTLDDTRQILSDYKENYPKIIKLVLQDKNVGIPKNKNSGFKASDGNFITYLDGDDFYYKDKIRLELKTFEQNEWADIVYSNFTITNFNVTINRNWANSHYKPIQGNIFKSVFTRDFPFRTLYRCELMKKKVLESIDYYDEKIKAFHDWDSRIRMTKKYKVAYNDYSGSAYVEDPSGISKQSKQQDLLNEMKYVVSKNKSLLDNVNEKDRIIKKIDSFFLLTQISIHKSFIGIFTYIIRHPLKIDGYKLLVRTLLPK